MINIGIVSSKQPPSIRGGTVSTIAIYEKNPAGFFVNNTYTVHVFGESQTVIVDSAGEFDYLLVAGGGGGGSSNGGGGGGGGFVENYNQFITPGQYPLIIGSGGAVNSDGSPSTLFGVQATGGGRGGIDSVSVAGSGGSGGGGGHGPTNAVEVPGAPGISGQGFPGGSGYRNSYLTNPQDAKSPKFIGSGGGGGGGAGGAGSPFSGSQTNVGGPGGPGRTSFISGSAITHSGGGGGQGTSVNGAGGPGGGGAGAVSGTSQTGGGGGGSASGGPGFVIIRYKK